MLRGAVPWTFCDAARERAIAEGVVARCLGVAADAVPRLAVRVAAAVREATNNRRGLRDGLQNTAKRHAAAATPQSK